MNRFIQYVGTTQQITQTIKSLVSSDTKLIDLTEGKELKSLFDLYSFFDPSKNNIKSLINTIKDNKVKKYIINECHLLNSSSIESLIDLYKKIM